MKDLYFIMVKRIAATSVSLTCTVTLLLVKNI